MRTILCKSSAASGFSQNNETPTPRLSPANRWNKQLTFYRPNPVIAALRETLVDADKVLKALNDKAERDIEQFIATIGTEQQHNHGLREKFLTLGEAQSVIWDVMRDAYSQGPDFEYAEGIKRRELRQALRTLNLGARLVTELLRASSFEFEPGNYRNGPRYRVEFAKQALYLAEVFAGKCSPGPRTYNHPQFSKWHKMSAQCKRRIAAIYLDDARDSEEKAETGPSCMQNA